MCLLLDEVCAICMDGSVHPSVPVLIMVNGWGAGREQQQCECECDTVVDGEEHGAIVMQLDNIEILPTGEEKKGFSCSPEYTFLPIFFQFYLLE